MPKDYAGRLPGRLEVNAKGSYFRSRVQCLCHWLDATFGLCLAFFKNGGVHGSDKPVAMRSDVRSQCRNAIVQRFG